MTAPARTLTAADFVLARIAEDYADAMSGWRWKSLPSGEYQRLQSRVLAQCEALRAVVVALSPHAHDSPAAHMAVDTAVRALASIWRDHPAFDPSWAAS